MEIVVPDYYKSFHCIADKCKHTCCVGWEIDIDEESLTRFLNNPYISPFVRNNENPQICLDDNERCPFLREDGLCKMIIENGEDYLCEICKDHPRFRNFWTNRTEIGLGLVCEEAARIILSRKTKTELVTLDGKEIKQSLPYDEQYLFDIRKQMLDSITETGPKARLKEYLIFRHIPDALYDGLLEERIKFVEDSYNEILSLWEKTDGSLGNMIECVRKWSYDVEYDEDEIEKRLKKQEGQ